jgi:DNA polymerase (family X)
MPFLPCCAQIPTKRRFCPPKPHFEPTNPMTNAEIVETLELTVKLLELHNADAFKTRSFGASAFNLDRFKTAQIADLPVEELVKIQGVGKSMANKIVQLVQTGRLPELEELSAKTPRGVLDMFKIKGLGSKKIGTLWRELGLETLQDLQVACKKGQIAQLKGFGEGTQQKILESLAFVQSQTGKLRMDKAEALAQLIAESLQTNFEQVAVVGEVARRTETVGTIQILVASAPIVALQQHLATIEWLVQDKKNSSPFVWRGQANAADVAIEIYATLPQQFESQRFLLSATAAHLAQPAPSGGTLLTIANSQAFASAAEIYQKANLPYVVTEMREGAGEFEWAAQHSPDELVTWEHLRGVLHNHSTYSDGKHTLADMARHCQALGFEYLGMADHSQSATYAQGLSVAQVRQQQQEIDQLNAEFALAEKPFKILKGIESDILGDGSLDYPAEVLSTFDYVVASVHSNLTMSLEKATTRLLRAIENPYTTILGHPTGRLLLTREGYPINHRAVIDACAQHGVVMEINASPWRLDLDWRWVRYCMDKGVMLSINPDAHEKDGYLDMHYGVGVARKGGLTASMTFNALTLSEIETFLKSRKTRLQQF